MLPRDVARIAILLNFGALAVVLAIAALVFGLTGSGGPAGSPFAVVVVLGGLGLLVVGVLLLGGAGADALWERWERLRGRGGAERTRKP